MTCLPSPERAAIPRAQLHRAILEIHRACATKLGPLLERGGIGAERLADVVRLIVLRALAAIWSDDPDDVRRGVAARGPSSVRWCALDGFASLEEVFEGSLALLPPERKLLGAARVDVTVAADLPLPAERAELAAFLGAAYEVLLLSRAHRELGVFVLALGPDRRRSGAHHTEPKVAAEVVARALAPLLNGARRGDHAPLSVCDPAMGSGAFLVEVACCLARELGGGPAQWVAPSLHGVDRDPIAVDLARIALFCLAGRTSHAARWLQSALVHADFVVRPDARRFGVSAAAPALDPASVFAAVAARGGFDAIVGNPPWVAFKGRAAQPIEPALADYLRATCSAFAGYVTLHGVFVERSVSLLRPGGRLGLVVPTSMADLDGYAPARRAHDALCAADPALPDYGADAFEGVFQPAMAILSTRRRQRIESAGGEWALDRPDGDPIAMTFVARLSKAPVLPERCFAERGFQTSGPDRACLAREPDARRTTPLRCGSDVTPFRSLPPSYWVDPGDLRRELRSAAQWAEVKLYVRQTARFPMACVADGKPFRNSILAAFETAAIPASFLLCYLNSAPVRFFHFQRFRDARQGMPQLKIAHLRRIPMPSAAAPFIAELARLGDALALRNDGIRPDEQARIDDEVASAWSCTDSERDAISAWCRGAGALPKSRRRTEPGAAALCSSRRARVPSSS